jgi:hypothetical protein
MIAFALTGCNGGGDTSAPSGSPQSSHSTASAGAVSSKSEGTRGNGGGTPYAGRSDAPGCMAAELRAELQVQTSNSEEKGIGTLILTNRSNHSCLLPAGWAPIGTGGPHDYTPLPATRTEYPGSGRNITLRAGGSAFAGMRWHTGSGCGTTSGLGVAWHSSWIPLRYVGLNGNEPPICDSLVLGTLQPTMNGVNFT